MIRSDFVSNSSSSSFMVGFRTRKDFDKFKNKILNEWGTANKFGTLLVKFFENHVCDPADYPEARYQGYDVLLSGLYQSTEDDFETLAPGLLVYENISYGDDDEGIQLLYD